MSAHCPACGADMAPQALDGHLGTTVHIDLCAGCQVIWFDHLESLKLSPHGTLRLFQVIGAAVGPHPAPLRDPLPCPRCDVRLLLTHDRQRGTPFQYWRCGRDHGRLITYFEFLREKDFIRPLSPQQLAALRANVQTVNCSNCGGPIDLARGSACAHCGSPISTLDLEQISRMANHLQQAGEPRKDVEVAALFEALKLQHQRESERDRESMSGLVETGLRMVADWLRR